MNREQKLEGALKELIAAVRTINHRPAHQIKVEGDDEPCYWQRKEWVDWILDGCDQADRMLAGPAPAQGELWAVHAQGPDELYAAFSREDAEQHAAALNALSIPGGIQVAAVVVPSPWLAAEHWKYAAEQEREHAADLKAMATRPAQTEQQPVAPAGWKLAPVKPTIEMVEAGYEASLGQPDRSGHARAVEVYEAMLNEAPIAPALQEQSGLVEALGMLSEGAQMLQSLIDNIESKGNYSQESTVLFLNQVLGCIRAALPQGGE